ncbi:ABC transporter ATP-binding protein [Solwaraspora sp. WMMA2101]|uniref:ABC transporter ATP-binding protein n=1 Tax=Solwaraspora sp. WMMA2101 TaxID=3404124 RepID=UPI003B9260AE
MPRSRTVSAPRRPGGGSGADPAADRPGARPGWVRRLLPIVRLRPGNLLIAFAATIGAGVAAAALLLVQRQVLDLAVAGDTGALPWPLASLVALGAVAYVAQRIAAYRELKGANDAQFLVYDAVHQRMQRIDPDSQPLPPGQLAARLNLDIDRMSRAVASLPRLLGAVVVVATAGVLMLLLHPAVGVTALLSVPLLLAVAWWIRRRVRPAVWDAQQREADVAQTASLAIHGVRVVKAFGQESRETARLAAAADQLFGSRMRSVRLQATHQPLLDLVPLLTQVAVVVLGGWLTLRGEISLGTFLALSIFAGQLIGSVRWLADSVVDLQEAGVCAERVLDLLDLPPAVVEDPAAGPLPPLRGDVSMDRVRFGYPGGAPVVDGLSLRVAAGESVALVGVAGSGKSTLLKLLARFHDPQSGAVRLDGTDLRTVTLRSLRRQVGSVFDEPLLFTGTIGDNIRYGRPDATDDEVEAVARVAGAHDFVADLPDGYATVVGDRGSTLSGGQRQRIALARTLLTGPRVLLLDDPTAGVDASLEWEIHRRLRDWAVGRTVIYVGYRAATIAVADRIVVLDAGRIVDQGRHAELLERCPAYRRLVDPQAAAGPDATAQDGPTMDADPTAEADPARPAASSARRGGRRGIRSGGGDERLRAAAARLAPPRDSYPVGAIDLAGPFSVGALLRPHRAGFAVVLALLAVQTVAGVLGPLFTRSAVDDGMLAQSMDGVLTAAAAILVTSLVGLLLAPVTAIVAGRAGQRVVAILRMIVWTRMIRLPVSYYERQPAGRLLTRLIHDVQGFAQFATTGLVGAVVAALTVVGVLVAMLVVDVVLATLVAVSVVPFILLLRWFNARLGAAFLAAREQMADANAALQENLAGVREAQAFGQQERQHAEYRRLIRIYLDHRLAAEKLIAASYPVVTFLSGMALTMVFGLGAVLLARGALTAGELIAFVLWVGLFFPPIVELGTFVTSDVQRVGVSTGRIRELFDEKPGPPPPTSPARPARIRGDLRLTGVRFRYPGTRSEVLHDVDLTVPAGTTLALVGPTGAGKSTIVKLLARFYDPDAGQVLLDGVPLADLDPATLRRTVGYLPQEPYLFAGTIRDNIGYGRPEATDVEIEAAARAVGAHQGVTGLPQGYGSAVGERGDLLSAGLRQLVCLARAYLVDPAVVLLDEATAKLDLSTEARVLAAVRAVAEGRTTVMIAHRLQTARMADRIAVVADGRIVEFGTHAQLVTAGGRYHQLWTAAALPSAPVDASAASAPV